MLEGDAYFSSGKYETAIKYYKKSLIIYTEIDHLTGRIKSIQKLGTTHYKLAQYHAAIEYCKSLEIGTPISEPLGKARSHCMSGSVFFNTGEHKETINCFKENFKTCTATGDQSGIAPDSGNLGNAYCNLRDYQKTIEYYKESLELNSAIGDQKGTVSNNGNLGNVCLSLGEYQKAIEYFEKGLEISRAIIDQSGIAIANGNLGNVYLSD